jgi:hypothetical protein
MSVAVDVETRQYKSFLGAGDYFWQSYEENQVTKNSPYDSLYRSSERVVF